MEDDAYPKYNKTEFYQKINKTINEIIILDSMWDIIQLHSDAFFPTKNTYSTHLISGSTAAYLISKNAIIKTMNIKLYSHMDFIEHNFFKFRKYRARENLFYTDEKNSLNRHKLNKNTFYYYSLLFKNKFGGMFSSPNSSLYVCLSITYVSNFTPIGLYSLNGLPKLNNVPPLTLSKNLVHIVMVKPLTK